MANFVSFNSKSYEAVCTTVKKLNSVLHKYRWIIDAYVSDFYTRDHWRKLPGSLQEYFDAVEPAELAWMLAGDGDRKQPVRCVIPLSLLALHCCLQNLTLKRVAVDMNSVETKSSISLSLCMKEASIPKEEANPQTAAASLVKTEANHKPHYKNGQCMDMRHIFRKHVKPKKQHEIDKLGQVIGLLSQLTSCSSVVDVGAGLGHLSRLLTFQYGLRVTSIEADDGKVPVAAAYDRQMKKDVHKVTEKRKVAPSEAVSSGESVDNLKGLTVHMKPTSENETVYCHSSGSYDCHRMNSSNPSYTCCNGKSSLSATSTNCSSEDKHYVSSNVDTPPSSVVSYGEDSLPSHVVCRVQPDIASSQFLEILKSRTHRDKVTEDERSSNFILVGLHACGDLTPTLLRVFVNSETAVGLASVACCYMKMSASSLSGCLTSGAADLDNYPMSQCLRCLPCSQLGYVARELACHFVDAYYTRLKDNSPHLKIHSFRAAVQYLINSVNPEFQNGSVKLVTKKQAQGSFLQYVTENLKKVGTDISTIPQDLFDYCENLTKCWKRVVAFYTLRLSLASAVETLILLDRALFLLENGVCCAVIPVFDPTISPRNFALLATKC